MLQLAAVAQACSLACTTEAVAPLMLVHQHANQLANQHLYVLLLANQFANQIHADAASQVFWHVFAPRWLLRRAAVALQLASQPVLQLVNQLQHHAANQLQLLAAKLLLLVNQLAHQAAPKACWHA